MLIGGAKGVGGLSALYLIGRGFRWLVEFCVGRIDKRQEALTVREKAFEARVEAELKGLHAQVAHLSIAVQKLSGELHRKDPGNPVLAEVAGLIAGSFPLTPTDVDGSMNDLLGKIP